MFADVTYSALFDGNGFIGVRNHWNYDQIYSTAMIASADKDGDGKLSPTESVWLMHAILDPLASSNYYNYVVAGSDFLDAGGIKDFKVNIKDGRIYLDFVVTFAVHATGDYSVLVIVVDDLTNYIQMTKDMDNCDAEAPDEMDVEFFSDGLDGLTLFNGVRSDVQGLYVRFKK